MRLTAGRRAAGRSGRFLRPLLECGQLHERVGRRQRKITPGQRQRLVNARAGIPEGCQQHLAVEIGNIVEQGTHFRCQQVFRQFILNESHLAQGQCGREVDGHRQLRGRERNALAWYYRHHCSLPLPDRYCSVSRASAFCA